MLMCEIQVISPKVSCYACECPCAQYLCSTIFAMGSLGRKMGSLGRIRVIEPKQDKWAKQSGIIGPKPDHWVEKRGHWAKMGTMGKNVNIIKNEPFGLKQTGF